MFIYTYVFYIGHAATNTNAHIKIITVSNELIHYAVSSCYNSLYHTCVWHASFFPVCVVLRVFSWF